LGRVEEILETDLEGIEMTKRVKDLVEKDSSLVEVETIDLTEKKEVTQEETVEDSGGKIDKIETKTLEEEV
jgi:hypothetical protein